MAYRYYDLVEQTSTTTGTGGYVMTSTVTGRRAFSAVTNGHVVPYGAVDDAGGYEFGIGTWNSGTSTLARTLVLSSSNSNSAVNWAAGERRVYITPHTNLMGMSTVRHSLGLTSSEPWTGDDADEGYGIGSFWVTTNNSAFICLDATASAAVWLQIATGQALVKEQNTASNESKVVATKSVLELRADPGGGYPDFLPQRGIVYDSGTPGRSVYQGALHIMTEDATPTDMEEADGGSVDISTAFGDRMAFAFEALVSATDGTDSKVMKVTVGGDYASGTITLGTATITDLYESAGATGWDVSVSSTTGVLRLVATGDATNFTEFNASYTLAIAVAPSF